MYMYCVGDEHRWRPVWIWKDVPSSSKSVNSSIVHFTCWWHVNGHRGEQILNVKGCGLRPVAVACSFCVLLVLH